MANEEEREIILYIYDMSKGLAKTFSAMFLGKELPGIWHTSIIAFDREYFFGGMGIESCIVGTTNLGEPDQILPLGKTEVSYSLFLEYLFSMGQSSFNPESYNLFENNCNHFTDEVAQFLTGKGIPHEIVNLPNEVLCTPIGQLLRQYLDSFVIRPQGAGVSFTNPIAEFRHIDSPETKESSPESKSSSEDKSSEKKETATMSEEGAPPPANPPTEAGEDEEIDSKPLVAPRKAYKYEDPPIVFKDIDGLAALKKVEEMVVNLLNPQQQQYLKEIGDYLLSDSGAWAIGDEHLELIIFLLSGGDGKFAPNVTLLTLEVLQAAALKEDVVLILHQDRKDHRVMSYINRIESLTLAEQEEVVKLLCNLCGQPSTIDWLLYISEWCEGDGQSASNSRVTVRAAVHTLLNDQLTTLQRNGVYLIYNLSLKEVFEDVSIELATAVLQYLHSEVPDDQALLCLTVIIRFIAISPTDVPALIKMLGPDFNKYKGKNDKMNKLVAEIEDKVAKLPNFS